MDNPAHTDPPLEVTSVHSGAQQPPAGSVVVDPVRAARRRKRRNVITVLLFVATCVCTFLAGMHPGDPAGALGGFTHIAYFMSGRFVWQPAALAENQEILLGALWNGLVYSGCVMLILFCHEMGHYLQARRYGVPATPPFFIPLPVFPFGTMGAVIVQGAGVADRRSLYDIAVSGPLAGLCVALPVAVYGVMTARIGPVPETGVGLEYGEPLLLQWLVLLLRGPIPEGHEMFLNAPLFAGWVGIFITALNLIPIGQLDGGHILYTLIGHRAHRVAALIVLAGFAAMVYFQAFAYAFMLLLLLLMGHRHPPTANDAVPLGTARHVLGWLTLAFVVIGFTLVPIIPPTGTS